MKRTDIMAHAMQKLGSPLYNIPEFYYTNELSKYFSAKQLPIYVRAHSGIFFYIFNTFKELEDKLPNTKLYPDDALRQSDGLHFRLEEYREEKF